MARRRRKAYARRRASYRRAPKKRYRRSRGVVGAMGKSFGPVQPLAIGVGFAREMISSRISPYTTRFFGFAGDLADEVGMAVTWWLVGRFMRNPTIRRVSALGLTYENLRVGEYIAGRFASNRTQVYNETM